MLCNLRNSTSSTTMEKSETNFKGPKVVLKNCYMTDWITVVTDFNQQGAQQAALFLLGILLPEQEWLICTIPATMIWPFYFFPTLSYCRASQSCPCFNPNLTVFVHITNYTCATNREKMSRHVRAGIWLCDMQFSSQNIWQRHNSKTKIPHEKSFNANALLWKDSQKTFFWCFMRSCVTTAKGSVSPVVLHLPADGEALCNLALISLSGKKKRKKSKHTLV